MDTLSVAERPIAQQSERSSPHVIAITSGKGGVGKSSIAVNLGVSLAKAGARVCIFDADTGLANINILLGLTPKASLEHVLFGAKAIEDIMLDGPYGLKVIPGANGISECVSLHPRQQLRLTRELARIEGDFDFLLLDTAAGIADTTLDFIGSAQQCLIVITPEPTSLTDAFSLIKLVHRRRIRIDYQVVVNMCGNVAQAREVYHRFSSAVERYIGVHTQFLGHLLRDESLRNAVVLQSPVALFPETDPSSRSFVRLADALRKSVEDHPAGVGFTSFWQHQFRQAHNPDIGKKIARAPVDARLHLAELKTRLLALVAKTDKPNPELAAMLDELQHAYRQRFGGETQDPQAMLDALIADPEKNKLLLSQLAERLSPWFPQPERQPEPQLQLQPLSTASDFIDSPALPVLLPAAPLPNVAMRVHGFDEERFGSQQVLLKLLQNPEECAKSTVELLDIRWR